MVWQPNITLAYNLGVTAQVAKPYAHKEQRPLKFYKAHDLLTEVVGFFISYRRSENTRFQNNPTQLSLAAHLSGRQFQVTGFHSNDLYLCQNKTTHKKSETIKG